MCKVCDAETKILVEYYWRWEICVALVEDRAYLDMRAMFSSYRSGKWEPLLQQMISDNTFVEVPLWVMFPTVCIVNRLPSSFYWLLHQVPLQLCGFFFLVFCADCASYFQVSYKEKKKNSLRIQSALISIMLIISFFLINNFQEMIKGLPTHRFIIFSAP